MTSAVASVLRLRFSKALLLRERWAHLVGQRTDAALLHSQRQAVNQGFNVESLARSVATSAAMIRMPGLSRGGRESSARWRPAWLDISRQ